MVPIVPDQYFWLIGCISAKQLGTCGQSRAITWESLEGSGAIASVLRESGTKKSDRLLFFNMFKNSSRSKPVGRWSSWLSEGPLKAEGRLVSPALWSFRVPCGALFYPLELLYTLCSSLLRIVRRVSQRIDSY